MSKQYNATLQAYNAQLQALIETANNLPEAGGSSRPSVKYNEVNFYDYDGTILYSYTVEEAQALTELPPLPTQPGLICQGWNYDLETIKSYNRAVNVGATYITDDGKTRLYIKIAAEGRMTVPLCFQQTVANGVTIDWGDGSNTETLARTGNVDTSHSYAEVGDYVISLEVTNGTLSLGRGASYCVMGVTVVGEAVYHNMLQKVEIGNSVTSIICTSAFHGCHSLSSVVIPNSITGIGTNAFYGCTGLTNIVIPDSVTNIGDGAFGGCSSLTSVVIPDSVTSIGTSAFYDCHSLSSVVIPNSATSIGAYAFDACYSLSSVVIPNSIISIGSMAFDYCVGMAIYDFTSHTSVLTLLSVDVLNGIPSDCIIKVPSSLLTAWEAATNWSAYANHIEDEFGNKGSDTGDSGQIGGGGAGN